MSLSLFCKLQATIQNNVIVKTGIGKTIPESPSLILDITDMYLLYFLYNLLHKFFTEERYGHILQTGTETARYVKGK